MYFAGVWVQGGRLGAADEVERWVGLKVVMVLILMARNSQEQGSERRAPAMACSCIARGKNKGAAASGAAARVLRGEGKRCYGQALK